MKDFIGFHTKIHIVLGNIKALRREQTQTVKILLNKNGENLGKKLWDWGLKL